MKSLNKTFDEKQSISIWSKAQGPMIQSNSLTLIITITLCGFLKNITNLKAKERNNLKRTTSNISIINLRNG